LVFPDQLFDDVLCSSVIEYLERPELVFREFHRVLRKDGRLFVSVANRYSVVRNAQRAIRPVARETGRDVFRYLDQVRVLHSEKGIARDLAASGFSIENIQFFDPFLPQFVWPVAPPALIFVTSLRL
jgi:2-polyprenyl-6-hydroxyphenyl methylase/3-demethylubiquinone-9 3-methyltransferase